MIYIVIYLICFDKTQLETLTPQYAWYEMSILYCHSVRKGKERFFFFGPLVLLQRTITY